jgi:hypothetical protein
MLLLKTRMVGTKQMEDQFNPEVCIMKTKPLNNLKLVAAEKTHVSLGNPTNIDEDGLLMDVDVQPVHGDCPTHGDKCDIIFFFGPEFLKVVNGRAKKCCDCKVCPYVSSLQVCFVFG